MTAPSLVFIYADEQAYRTLAAYGNHRIKMPNLDRLASISHVFPSKTGTIRIIRRGSPTM